VPGVATRAFLLPADFVRSPEARSLAYSAEESAAYTRWLARRHYENFNVVSFSASAAAAPGFL
jgi:hypothetical protein